jgi:outer membrane protein OmpA-like peptidoglycan-associated protein
MPSRRLLVCSLPCVVLLALAGCGARSTTELTLRRVVLYQNGIGYFEHTGKPDGQRIDLAFRRHEIGDVLKTITIVSTRPAAGVAATMTTSVPGEPETDPDAASDPAGGSAARRDPAPDRVGLSIALDRPAEEVAIAYAVPMPTWKASYRLVLPPAGKHDALLQGWAIISNTSEQDWRNITLTLATGAPLSFAIDLQTPEYVARPDLNGKLVEPVITGPVRAERALPGDGDGDGVKDENDLCANDAEDRDAWEDEDGCADPDNDKDRILDADDQCPREPETYNGTEDEDGCPDRGRVVVTDTSIEILDKIYFRRGSADVNPQSLPIVDATAEVLKGNPDIRAIEVQGHTSDDEANAWDLSGRRALAIKSALESRGVRTRIVVTPYGPTQPVRAGTTEEARANNRRVEFLILERAADDAPTASTGAVTAPRMQASMRAQVLPRDVAGSVRYEVGAPVTIARGATALVPILNQRMEGEDVYLYRPDASAPLSSQHPWRAGRLVNQGALPLQPGPVAMFAGGAFVGEGLIDRLHPDESAFVPYALDSSAVVREQTDDRHEPVRIVAIARGVAKVEDYLVHATRYEIQTGASVPARMFVRHVASDGFEVLDLPPQTQKTGSGYLVPIPLAPARTSVLEIKERKLLERSIEIADHLGPVLNAYASSENVPEKLRDALQAAALLRQQLAGVEAEIDQLSEQVLGLGYRATEVRASLQAIGRDPRAAQLRRKLLDSLGKLIEDSEKLGRALAERRAAQVELQARLQDAVQALAL